MNKLTEIELAKKVPSIFSTQGSHKVSQNYSLIPTIECIRAMEKAEFVPVKAFESRCRNSENKPYVRHLVRFRHESALEKEELIPEIIMINSHNGTTSYQLRGGIYRLVCSNGLIVGDEVFERRIKHQGDVISKVVEACGEIIDIVPEAIKIAEEWKSIRLNREQQKVYAQSAALLKWNPEEIEIQPEKILSPNRTSDFAQDLWTTFNVVQEKLIRGGVRYVNQERTRRGTTRGTTSVSENVRLNTALWNLTQKMSELAT